VDFVFRFEAFAGDEDIRVAGHYTRFREKALNTVRDEACLSHCEGSAIDRIDRRLFSDPGVAIERNIDRKTLSLIHQLHVLNDAPNRRRVNELTFADVVSNLAADLYIFEIVSEVAAEEVDRRVAFVRSVPRHYAIQSDLRVVVESSEVGLTLVNQKLEFNGACPFGILIWPAHRALYNIFAHLLWRLLNVDRLTVLSQGEVALYVLGGREASASD
jgi:hypothetical protein